MADFAPGFVMQEALDAICLCMQLNGTGIDGMDAPAMDERWRTEFDSRQTDPSRQEKRALSDGTAQAIEGMGPFDNAWAAWKCVFDENLYAIVIRGTVGEVSSILDDVLATSVEANAPLPISMPQGSGKQLPLFVVSSQNADTAAVHLGFIWGTAILLYHETLGILRYLLSLPSGSKVLIAGHSQGAAIATLVHAVLLHATTDASGTMPEALKAKSLSFKSYVFAQPRPGNWQFGQDFAQAAGNRGMALCINNSRDWVPQVPLTMDMPDEVAGNPIDPYLSAKHPILKRLADIVEASARDARSAIGEVAQKAADRAMTYLGQNMPAGTYLLDGTPPNSAAPYLNYVQCGRLYSLAGQVAVEESTDPLWQHHCGNYYKLLMAQGAMFK